MLLYERRHRARSALSLPAHEPLVKPSRRRRMSAGMEYTRYVVCKFRASETRISDRFHSSDIHFRVAPCLL